MAKKAGALSTIVLGKTIVALARTANRQNKLASESAQNAIEHAVRGYTANSARTRLVVSGSRKGQRFALVT